MPLTYGSNTYAGKAAERMIADTILKGSTIDGGHITVHPAVKGKKVIQTISTDAVFQARADLFNSSGATSVGERILSLTNLMVNETIGITTLLNTWQSMSQADSANDKDLPTEMSDFIIQLKADLISKQVDELIWRGDTALTSNPIRSWHDGLIKLFLADSGVRKFAASEGQLTITNIAVGATTTLTMSSTANLNVGDKVTCLNFAGADAATLNGQSFSVLSKTSTTIVIDAVTTGLTITDNTDAAYIQYINTSNVLTYMANAYRVTREQDRNADDFRIYVPRNVADAYIDASLNAATGQGSNFEKEGNLVYKSKTIVPCDYFPDNTVVTTRVSNLHFGTDLTDDMNEVSATYLKPATADDVYRFVAKFSSSVNYGFAAQVQMIRPA